MGEDGSGNVFLGLVRGIALFVVVFLSFLLEPSTASKPVADFSMALMAF